jgi:hypothetical protein
VNRLPDLVLDTPNARELVLETVDHATAAEIITDETAHEMRAFTNLCLDPTACARITEHTRALVKEFFASGDVDETALAIDELGAPGFQHEVVKVLLSVPLECGSREREMASFLLACLVGDHLRREEIERAFALVLQRVEELSRDVPDVLLVLASFVTRAVPSTSCRLQV